MKNQFHKSDIQKALILESDLSWESITCPKGQYGRLTRRVGVWLYDQYLNYSKSEICELFGIDSIQSIYRILRKKNLPADEYDLRMLVKRRLEKQLELRAVGSGGVADGF